jgi:glutamate--cysteine ligase
MHGPLQPLEQCLLEHQAKIEAWFRQQFQMTPPPFYASVDLRNSGFKIAPVDTNLFPAGFNNLNPATFPLAIHACQATLEDLMPGCVNILLIPENHTRNAFYFENLHTLRMLIMKAGFNVKVGSLLEELTEPKAITVADGQSFFLEPITRVDNRLMVGDFSPCLILLNNDLSGNIPDLLKNLNHPIFPALNMGWGNRTKTHHFEHYAKVSQEFATLIDIDPWFVAPLFKYCSSVNFMNREGENCLIKKTDELLSAIFLKYQQYQIEKKPFVTIKADTGTYGIGVMMLDDPESLKHLSRKARKEMSVTKGGKKLDRVIIQEGVYTHETWGEEKFSAEPVVYMIGKYVIGGFYRIHPERGENQNLNSPGMKFIPLAFTQSCNNPDYQRSARDCPNRFYAYGVIARLALIAAAREMIDVSGENVG